MGALKIARRKFAELFCREADTVAFAPGRVNLIGEHIDYAGGPVLPMAIEQGITIAASRGGNSARISSAEHNIGAIETVRMDGEAAPGFPRFVQTCMQHTGITGLELAVVSDLPVGMGLSSSAALCVGVLSAMASLSDKHCFDSPLELAQAAQQAEIEATGVKCGLMDQYASVHGHAGSALGIDLLALRHGQCEMGLGDSRLVVVNSGQPRRLAQSGYNQRRLELENAFEELREIIGPIGSPLEVEAVHVWDAMEEMNGPSKKRLRHLMSETRRVHDFAFLLPLGMPTKLGGLLNASHRSLMQDYEVSTEEIDMLVAILQIKPDVHGARIVGGGFGGAVLALVRSTKVDTVMEDVVQEYGSRTGLNASWLEVEAGDGAQVWLPGREKQPVTEWLQ